MIPPDPRILKIWNEKVEVNVQTVSQALDDLAHLMVLHENMSEQMLPIFERLERELAILHEKEATMQRVRDRVAAVKIKKKNANGDSLRMSHNQNGDSRMGGIPTLLQINQVCEKIGVKKSTVYKWMDEQKFPRPLKLSPTCVRWREDDIVGWLSQFASQIDETIPQVDKTSVPKKAATPFIAHPVDAESLQTQVRLAIEGAGGVVALACAIGIRNHQTLYGWKHIPAEHVLKVEAATGIPCCELRPDIYPPERFSPLPPEAF